MISTNRRLHYFRYTVIAIATVVGLLSLASCCLTLMMKNVYFRPVHHAVETGEGDPYMIALDCVAVLAAELEFGLTGFAISALTLLVSALLWPADIATVPIMQDGG